jgi:hypothetical protein
MSKLKELIVATKQASKEAMGLYYKSLRIRYV